MHPFNPLGSAHGRGAHDSRARIVSQLLDLDSFSPSDIDAPCSRRYVRKLCSEALDANALALDFENSSQGPIRREAQYHLTAHGEECVIAGVIAFHESLTTWFYQDMGITESDAKKQAENSILSTGWVQSVFREHKATVPEFEQDHERAVRLLRALNHGIEQ